MIIGFAGPAGSGKSLASHFLINRYGFVRRSFAYPLKSMLRTLLLWQGVTLEHCVEMLYGDAKAVPTPYLNGETPRKAMQLLGTEWGRALHPDLWLDLWKRSLPPGVDVVCDDVRFVNEASAVHGLGGKVIRIERPSMQALPGGHASESQEHWPFCDGVIVNDSTKSEFLSRVNRLVTKEDPAC